MGRHSWRGRDARPSHRSATEPRGRACSKYSPKLGTEVVNSRFSWDRPEGSFASAGAPQPPGDGATATCPAAEHGILPTRFVTAEQTMVLTKSELIASLQNEVRILLHLAGIV